MNDPKGTRWARYTTTQHGPMPVKAAAGVKSANARAARPGVSNYQLKKAVATPETLIARGTLCPGHKRVPRAHGIINFGRGL